MRCTLKYGRTGGICTFVSLVVFAFRLVTLIAQEKIKLHLLFLAMDTCPAFQLISLIHLFIYCIFAVLVTYILIYGPKSYLERRELNNEKPAVNLISSDLESLPVSICLWFYFCTTKPKWTPHTWGSWTEAPGVSLPTSSWECIHNICILIYHGPH